MDFTNINDPAGISALLEQLRSSQTWADLQAQKSPEGRLLEPQPDPVQPPVVTTLNDGKEKTSVASLLSQLTSTSSTASSSTPPAPVASMSSSSSTAYSAAEPSIPSSRPTKDVRNFTFQQALPQIAQLSDDPAFLEAVSKLRRDQSNMEKQLWEERQALHAKQAEKVKIAVTKANMLGTGISEREANAMRQVFENELSKFDRERVMPAWDGLVARQQATFEKLGVPAMFSTTEAPDRERQQRVIQVLEGILGPSEANGTS